MSVEDLIAAAGLVPPPGQFDWHHAEEHLRMLLPVDYRQLVDAGGAGLWFDYLRVLAPNNHAVDLSLNLLEADGVFQDLLMSWEEYPESCWPPVDLADGSRLISWGNHRDGGTVYWLVDPGAPPESYPIYVESYEGDSWERFDMTTTDFLWGVLRGEIVPRNFSEFGLRVNRVFHPYGE